jgi:hypothetical protein
VNGCSMGGFGSLWNFLIGCLRPCCCSVCMHNLPKSFPERCKCASAHMIKQQAKNSFHIFLPFLIIFIWTWTFQNKSSAQDLGHEIWFVAWIAVYHRFVVFQWFCDHQARIPVCNAHAKKC